MPEDILESKQSFTKFLDSFLYRPNIEFESQEEGEEVLLLLRAHPVTFVPWILTALLFFFIPIFLNVVLIEFFTLIEVFFIDLVWYSLIFSYIFIKILSWFFNVGIVTNLRIVNIDFSKIIENRFTATSLGEITDVSKKTSGFIRSMLQYGDVFIQTAGTKQNIEFESVPNPIGVVTIINRLM